MDLDQAMDDRYVPAADAEDNNLTRLERLWFGEEAHVEKEDVSSVEARLHATTQHDHHLRIDERS